MQSQDGADILQLKRRTGGDLIAVGLPWDSVIFIQEYWAGGIPYYAVANISTEAATVAIAEWSGVVGRRLTGPWVLAPETIQHYDVRAVQTDYSGPLVAVSLNENPVHGLLKPPRHSSELAGSDNQDRVLTTYGLNGIGDRYANLSCAQERLVLDSGQTAELTFKVPVDAGIISFAGGPQVERLPRAVVVGATSKTLPVEARGGSYSVAAGESAGAAFHEFTLEVRLPGVEAETMAALWGHVASPNGAGFYFARGLVVAPSGV